MRYLGYVAIFLDFILGNIHLAYGSYPSDIQWYASDVGEFARIVMWVCVARFWVRSSRAENNTIIVHIFYVSLDELFVINGTMYGLDSSWLILSEVFAILLVQLYHKLYDN